MMFLWILISFNGLYFTTCLLWPDCLYFYCYLHFENVGQHDHFVYDGTPYGLLELKIISFTYFKYVQTYFKYRKIPFIKRVL